MGNLLWSPLDPAHINDPYLMYKRLRHESPVYRSQTGEYIITRYADVKSILKNTDYRTGNRLEWLSRGITYFKNRDEDFTDIYKAINSFILFLNAPDHGPIRNMVVKAWSDREVHEMITTTADEILKDLNGTFDLVNDYARELPAIVIARIMGIPMNDYRYLQKLGVSMISSLNLYHSWKDFVELNEASALFVKYFAELLDAKQKNPDRGLVSRLLAANEKEKLLRQEQLISVLIFLFVAGEETTGASIGTSLRNIIQHDIKYNGNVDELFRFDPVVQILGRITKTDSIVNGVNIPANSALTLVVGSANRDESQFPNPDIIDVNRSAGQHLSFGYGTHFCLGEWLGKLQTQIAIERFFIAFKDITIPDQNIEWNTNLSVRVMKSLIVNAKK
ncbi:MAG TPA: cytochrome P450 [Cyclobacteriaceae bacterium]|nr:cytochrome P450 [Cyclobacteriaceae bacterium]